MKLENELNADILNITMKIRNVYPELYKYLNEMTETIPDISKPEMNTIVLFNYYNSLDSMLKEYKPNH
jgi:hypothetical protein